MPGGAVILALVLARVGLQEPPVPPQDPLSFDLDLKGAQTGEILRQIGLQTGCFTHPDGKANFGKSLDVSFRKIGFWQAIDEICRLHGNLRHSPASSYFWTLAEGPWAPESVSYAGAYRFSIIQVVRVRELEAGKRQDRTEVFLRRQVLPSHGRSWDPSGRQGTVEVRLAQDGQGRSLLPPPGNRPEAFRFTFGEEDWPLKLLPLPPGEPIARLEGVWKGVLLEQVEEVVFENAAGSAGATKTLGPLSVVLQACRNGNPEGNPHYWRVELLLKAELGGRSEDERRSYLQVPLGRRVLREVKAGPRAVSYGFQVQADPADPTRSLLIGWVSSRPEELRFQVARRAVLVEAPFSFAGIPTPLAPK